MPSLRKATEELYARLAHREDTGVGFHQRSINPIPRVARNMRRQATRNRKSAAIRQRKLNIPYNASNPFDSIYTMPPAAETAETASLASISTSATHMPGRRSTSLLSDVSTFQEGSTPDLSQQRLSQAPKRLLREESAESIPSRILEARQRAKQLQQENDRKQAELDLLVQQARQRELDTLLDQARGGQT